MVVQRKIDVDRDRLRNQQQRKLIARETSRLQVTEKMLSTMSPSQRAAFARALKERASGLESQRARRRADFLDEMKKEYNLRQSKRKTKADF